MTEGITLLTWRRIIKHYIEDLIFKTFKKLKKNLKNILKVVKNNQNLVKKNVLITKILKSFSFFGQQSKQKKWSCFSWCFYMESPFTLAQGINKVLAVEWYHCVVLWSYLVMECSVVQWSVVKLLFIVSQVFHCVFLWI